jgi:hypothetical protein
MWERRKKTRTRERKREIETGKETTYWETIEKERDRKRDIYKSFLSLSLSLSLLSLPGVRTRSMGWWGMGGWRWWGRRSTSSASPQQTAPTSYETGPHSHRRSHCFSQEREKTKRKRKREREKEREKEKEKKRKGKKERAFSPLLCDSSLALLTQPNKKTKNRMKKMKIF